VDLDEENDLVKYLKYDSAYNLAVCIDCGYGLPLEWIAKHFKDVHKVKVMFPLAVSNTASSLRI
jgi:hypothetical protein